VKNRFQNSPFKCNLQRYIGVLSKKLPRLITNLGKVGLYKFNAIATLP
jgi:hypothetical protein